MATADSRHIISCPKCGARFAVAGSLAGRKARCDACDEAFVVPPLTKAAEVPQKHETQQDRMAPAPAKSEELIGLECRVCGTRLYGRREHVGLKIKCPDCGAGTEIPPPPKPKALNMPAALFGEQYELWDADEQPLPSELAAAQPKYVAVTCRVCSSLMYAGEDQVGQPIVCVDCGTKNVVTPPGKPVVRPAVLAADRETPKLDPTAAPAERPPVIPHTLGLSLAERRAGDEYATALAASQRRGRPMKLDVRGRPVLPRFPLLAGVFSIPFFGACFTRWGLLSFTLFIWAFLVVDGAPSWAGWTGSASGAVSAMGGLAETALGLIGAIIWIAALSNIFLAIASQCAVGAERIEDWPSMNFIYSMGEMLPLGIAVLFAAAPGWMLAKLVAQEPWQSAAWVGGSLTLGLPIVVLSQLAGNSTWELLDVKVLGAMARCPFSILLFYMESVCLLVLCSAVAWAAWHQHPYLPLAAAPLVVGCLLLYARLLGRLGWRLAEKIAVDDGEEEPTGPKNYNPPRGKSTVK